MTKEIRLIPHAEEKFLILAKGGFTVTREQVEDTVRNPDTIKPQGYRQRARKAISENYYLNVVFTEDKDTITVITFFPNRR